jgi:hypothetical protein
LAKLKPYQRGKQTRFRPSDPPCSPSLRRYRRQTMPNGAGRCSPYEAASACRRKGLSGAVRLRQQIVLRRKTDILCDR